ncbi:MAG: hypothetical protein IKZ02_04840 [Alphaproteobacteria bacterium]|nr:hypothetical protein [Alphaproteobacteria bacterium]
MRIKLNECGRSMIEILGVLAIIGVLSVGAVAGYRYAMDKYRANDIVYEVNMRATDVWHRFQDKPLPALGDATAFSEWNNTTQTGYPITISPFPDVAFKIGVQNVSSRVCKNVMTMNLHQIIEGFQFAQINGAKYLGDASLCGNDETINEIVFTSFLDSQDPNTQHCVEDSDCNSKCAEKVCNGDTMTCDDQCPEWSKPVRLEETCECVECVKNSDCKFKGKGYICDETTYTCSALQKVCPAGTFRTQNGACVACDNGSNFIVLKNGEPFPNTEDTVDGYTMCQQCADSGDERQYGTLVDDDERAYCSFMCTKGYSYQSLNKGCIPCSDTNRYSIPNDNIAKAQCLACSDDHAWYSSYLGGVWCQRKLTCTADEFIKEGTPYTCSKCSENRNARVQVWWVNNSSTHSDFKKYAEDTCNSCPDSAPRYTIERYCYPVCEQPKNAEEQIEICKANPKDERCTRQWQNVDGKCFSCSTITSASLVGTAVALKTLCENCGRRVNSQGYCVPTGTSACDVGQFLGANGTCYDCSPNNSIVVESDELSGCSKNCRKETVDSTKYVETGTIETREVRFNSYAQKTYCVPICKENYIYESFWAGGCVSCGSSTSTGGIRLDEKDTEKVAEDCAKCSNRAVYYAHGKHCSIKQCPDTETEKYYKDREGNCVKCSRANSGDGDGQYGSNAVVDGIALCNACGNRMIVKDNSYWGTYCRLVDIDGDKPISGICNSIGNENYTNAKLTSVLQQAAEPYINGEKDGLYYRSNDGYCRSCDSSTSYTTTPEQCASCKNRRYENGSCSKGLCDSGFFLSGSSCLACSNVNKPIDPSRENLCSSCSDRRQLEIGTPNTSWSGLCVEECSGTQWQDINGNCLFCSEGGTREIGTDTESRRLCNECDGLREEQPIYSTDGTTIIGYKCVLK